MDIGYVCPVDRPFSPLARDYLQKLETTLEHHFAS